MFYGVDVRFLTFVQNDLNHVEAPRDVSCAQQAKPFIGTALHQLLLPGIDRIERAAELSTGTGLDLHEGQGSAIPGDDIYLAPAGSTEVAGKNTAPFRS